ncbi:hypothetical protein CFC21_075313 [Triticum aestivum]|uniref:DEUBAD domain-containing protein n=3 Tax=Triticum aestivum TaxID=4565 RepID=A0A3B6LZ59_WHEAT|nr:hypothetical protein CFC21_075313 [Triticum aestivum]
MLDVGWDRTAEGGGRRASNPSSFGFGFGFGFGSGQRRGSILRVQPLSSYPGRRLPTARRRRRRPATGQMSAGQPRKRPPNAPPPNHHQHQQQHRSSKRARPEQPPRSPLLTLSSHIHLRWDDRSRRALPADDQIGIPWRHLAPFIDSPPRARTLALADVAPVPRRIFSLADIPLLGGVLSYQVWDACLTEADRRFLARFLPAGSDAEEAVQDLLTGENHHFGNPLLTWSSALCSGDLHPDALLNKEQQIRADKKAYHAQLKNYHSDMTDTVTRWRDKWLTCDNPKSLFRDNLAKQRRGDRQSSGENVIFSNAPKNAIPMKVVRNGDVTKYMSYIKVSRAQHELVKGMKQSGDGIQTRHLVGVIGDIDNFHVKPYETLMEDEKQKLHDHWVILSCKELPAAFKARREEKLIAEKLRRSLCLEIAERNISEVEKAEQLGVRTAEVGQDGAYRNGGTSDRQEELVEHSPQDVPQSGNNSSVGLEDEEDANDTSDTTDTSTDSHDSPNTTDQDGNDTSDTGTSTDSHDGPNVTDQDVMDMNNTNMPTQSQGTSDEQDEEVEKISSTSAKSGDSSDAQDEAPVDISCRNGISQSNPGMEDDDMEDTSCKDATLQDHHIPDMQSQEPKAISGTISPIQGINSPNMLVQDCKKTGYIGFPIHVHGGFNERTDDLKDMCYPSASTGHDNENEMNGMILDQRETDNITMIPSDSTLSRQSNVKGPELKGPAECQKELWQPASPVDSLYHPPGNGLYAQSGALQLKHHPSGGPATCMVDLISVPAAQATSNSASLLQPCTNQLSSEQLLNGAKGVGMVPSYSLGHVNGIKQSMGLHSMTNGHLAQSGLAQEQMQLLGERHSGLYSQQVENNINMYSSATLCTQNSFPMVEPQSFAGHVPADQGRSWFPDEDQPSHNNWSGMGGSNGVVLGQDLPGGDGSLLSVLSQYKQQVSSRPLGSDQQLVGGRRNLVPPHGAEGMAGNILAPAPDMYGYTHQNNVASSQVDGNLQWAHPHPSSSSACFRQFGGAGPWSR